jgi:tight adherence protein C
MIVLTALIFIAVSCALVAAFMWVAPSRTQQRLQAIAPAPDKTEWRETAVRLAEPLSRLSTPDGDWESSPLRLRFLNAGMRSEDVRLMYFGAKTFLPVLLASATYVALRMLNVSQTLTLLMWVLLAALIGCYAPNLLLYLKVKDRQLDIFHSFPDATDLMLVCVEAGLALDAALVKVAEEIKGKSIALAEELHLTTLEMRAGGTREKALRNLALRTGLEEVGTFATMLTQADKFGTSVGDSLRVFSDDLRHKRQMRAEERAAKIPTKMLVPLVLFIFPSIIMVILGPAVITIIRTILPLLAGKG